MRPVVRELHDRRGHGDAALLLEPHPVGGGVARGLAALDGAGQLDRAAEQQQLLGERGLAGVGVRDDGEGAATRHFVERVMVSSVADFTGNASSLRTSASSRPSVGLVVAAAPADLDEAQRLVQRDRVRVRRPHLEEHVLHARLRASARAAASACWRPMPRPRTCSADAEIEHVRLARAHRDDAVARRSRRRISATRQR